MEGRLCMFARQESPQWRRSSRALASREDVPQNLASCQRAQRKIFYGVPITLAARSADITSSGCSKKASKSSRLKHEMENVNVSDQVRNCLTILSLTDQIEVTTERACRIHQD